VTCLTPRLVLSIRCRLDMGRLRETAQAFSHRDQFGERAGLKLFHHALPMRLDRPLAHAKLVGNLLVHPSTDDQSEDLPFSWRQLVKTRALCVQTVLLLQPALMSRHGTL
jgi:hypothetical protein